MMRYSRTRILLAVILLVVGSSCRQADNDPAGETGAPADRAELEEQFRKTLSGATLVGQFTIHGKDLREEKYTIEKVSKLTEDYWLFQARIQYGDHDVTLPLPLQVKWAGDTPVITLTDLNIPGLGTYTARVLIYRNQYVGTWSGGEVGGQMFGKITKQQDPSENDPP